MTDEAIKELKCEFTDLEIEILELKQITQLKLNRVNEIVQLLVKAKNGKAIKAK